MTEDITMLEKLSERQLRLAMLLSMDSFYLEDLAKKIAVTKKHSYLILPHLILFILRHLFISTSIRKFL